MIKMNVTINIRNNEIKEFFLDWNWWCKLNTKYRNKKRLSHVFYKISFNTMFWVSSSVLSHLFFFFYFERTHIVFHAYLIRWIHNIIIFFYRNSLHLLLYVCCLLLVFFFPGLFYVEIDLVFSNDKSPKQVRFKY